MINLIKNELVKVFRKKAIYVLCAITLVLCAINFFMVKGLEKFENSFDDSYYSMLENGLDSYNLNDPSELGWYISDKVELESYKLTKEYDYESWQYYVLTNNATQYVSCMVNAEVNKNDEEYNSCKSSLDALVKEVESNDWKYFVLKDKNANEEELNLLKDSINVEGISENEKYSIQLEIEKLELVDKGYNYRLDNEIPYGETDDSLLIDQYVSQGVLYLDLNKDESSYDFDGLVNKRQIESDYLVAEYKLENDIKSDEMFGAASMLLSETGIVVFFILIAAIMIAGSIVADEFNKGTIKQLLLRPYTRGKILISKYITSIIVFLLFAIFYYAVSTISYGLASGFESLSMPVVLYDYNINAIREMSLFSYWLVNFVAIIPNYLVILTFAFALGTLSGNTAVAVCGSFMIQMAISIINGIVTMVDNKLLQFMPTLCFDWTHYLFGGLAPYKYCEAWSSILVTVLVIVVMYVIAYIVFKKKDIKNQ